MVPSTRGTAGRADYRDGKPRPKFLPSHHRRSELLGLIEDGQELDDRVTTDVALGVVASQGHPPGPPPATQTADWQLGEPGEQRPGHEAVTVGAEAIGTRTST